MLCMRYCKYAVDALSTRLRCRTLIGTSLLCGFVWIDCVVRCCAVVCLRCSLLVLQYNYRRYCRRSTTTCLYMVPRKGPQNAKKGNMAHIFTKIKIIRKERDLPACNRSRRCLSGSSERPGRCERSLLRKKDICK